MGSKKKAKHDRTKRQPEHRTQGNVIEKLSVVDWYHANGRNQTKTAAHFNELAGFTKLNQSTVGRWVRDEVTLRLQLESGDGTSIRSKPVKHPELEECLRAWIEQVEQTHASRITGDVIKEVATRSYDKLEIPDEDRVALSNGWLDKFKRRHGIQLQLFRGEASSAPQAAIQPERNRVAGIISAFLAEDPRRTLGDVWNADETSFFYACVPDRGLPRAPRPGVKQSRTRMTLLLSVNATDTERLPPLFIAKRRMPRCFKKKLAIDHGFQCFYNKTAWMAKEIFAACILLFLDNFSGHNIDKAKLSSIHIEFFTVNLTAHVQSCGAGVIRAFKAYFRRETIMRTIDKLVTSNANADLFAIDQLMAMHMAKTAWRQVKADTIKNCWNHTNILPCRQADLSTGLLAEPAIKELEEALADLSTCASSRGQYLNLMAAADFVDIDDNETGFGLCREEILDLVVTITINSDSQADELETEHEDQSQENEEALSLTGVYKALLSIEKFWRGNSANALFDLQQDASGLLWDTRLFLQKGIDDGKKQTHIADYFRPKGDSI